ncbi:MAG: AraC family transcriptional regulator [Gammaproteobacteria bacterium]|nr:AraC family transcriptional regulator [Gammaproteobacteria bacterium]
MSEHRNTSASVRMVLKACEDKGVDTDELLSRAGISRATAEDPDGEVSFEEMRNFWRTAYELSRDPYLAMHAGMHVTTGTFQCYDYLILNAGSIQQAIENYVRYMALINTWIGWEIVDEGSQIRLQMKANSGALPPPTPEYVFTILARWLRQILKDPDWSPVSVRFTCPPPGDPTPLIEFFGCLVRFESAVAEFILDDETWHKTVPTADENLLRILDQHAQSLLEKRILPDDFVGKVRQEIIKALHGNEATRECIAERLCMSSKTLQRRLDEHSIVFSELVDEVRGDLAKTHLARDDMPLAEIGYLLGFSEQSSFTRAFKRWTGKTPREYRKSVGV